LNFCTLSLGDKPKNIHLDKKPRKHSYDETEIVESDQLIFNGPDNNNYRLINANGTFNIDRRGKSGDNIYEAVLAMSWAKILVCFAVIFFLFNCVFGLVFMMIGPEDIRGLREGTWFEEYIQMIYFSIQTFTTVGFGHMSPKGNAVNLISAFVAFVGLISFAIFTGLSFTKFSKPKAHILFSDKMLIAPNTNRNNIRSLQFRIVNATSNQIIDLEARVTIAWLQKINGGMRRKFKRLDLEFESIHLFPLNWTIVHNIDEDSPLYGKSLQKLIDNQLEVLVLIKGFDDTYSQTVHSKRSYSFSDLIDGARFKPMYRNTESMTILELSKIDDVEEYVFEV
jgi:inward rectifier potassium channel